MYSATNIVSSTLPLKSTTDISARSTSESSAPLAFIASPSPSYIQVCGKPFRRAAISSTTTSWYFSCFIRSWAVSRTAKRAVCVASNEPFFKFSK